MLLLLLLLLRHQWGWVDGGDSGEQLAARGRARRTRLPTANGSVQCVSDGGARQRGYSGHSHSEGLFFVGVVVVFCFSVVVVVSSSIVGSR
jgi:hypothetical protein